MVLDGINSTLFNTRAQQDRGLWNENTRTLSLSHTYTPIILWLYRSIETCEIPDKLSVSQGVTKFNWIFSNLRKRKLCPCGSQLSREVMVISISIEFYILPEKPQRDYAWIFKIAVHGEGGYEKMFWMGTDKICATLYIPQQDKSDVILFSTILSYDHACSYSQHTNHINHLQSTVQNKKDLWSEGSDVALQLKSSVYVCDCVQGLQVAYRFEYFPPIWNPVWLRLWMRNLRHMRTYKQQQPYSIFLHVHDYCKSYLFH